VCKEDDEGWIDVDVEDYFGFRSGVKEMWDVGLVEGSCLRGRVSVFFTR